MCVIYPVLQSFLFCRGALIQSDKLLSGPDSSNGTGQTELEWKEADAVPNINIKLSARPRCWRR